jgi:SAM-dependent methyltransferase
MHGNDRPEPSTPSPKQILSFTFGFAPPIIINAAVETHLFDALSGGPLALDAICGKTGCAPRGMRMLLNALVGLELLTRDEEGRYALTPAAAEFLVSGKPMFHGGMFRHVAVQLIPIWLELASAVRTGRPVQPQGPPDEEAAFFEQFVEALFPLGYPATQVLADHLRLDELQRPLSVLDLAAGSGVWGIGLARRSDQVRVTAVDYPQVLGVTRRMADRFGLSDRFRFVGGDVMEADLGRGHDIATLGMLLHSIGPRRSARLMHRVFAALEPGGTIVITEWLVDDQRTGPLPSLIFALNMLVNTEEGDTFSFSEISRWLLDAGFVDPRTLDAPGPSPIILATRP